jgi:hypothetical protein
VRCVKGVSVKGSLEPGRTVRTVDDSSGSESRGAGGQASRGRGVVDVVGAGRAGRPVVPGRAK